MSSVDTSVKFDSIRSRLSDIATGIEVNELPNGLTAIDFNLFALHDDESEMQQQRGERNGGKRLGDYPELSGQRSGGLFKSSVVVDDSSNVVEYNFRLPPLPETQGRGTILRKVYRAFDRFDQQHSYVDKSVMIRPAYNDDQRARIEDFADLHGIALEDRQVAEHLVHIRHLDCSESVSNVLDLLEFVLEFFGREYPEARPRTADTRNKTKSDSAEGDAVTALLGDLKAATGGIQLRDNDRTLAIEFSLWGDMEDGEVGSQGVSVLHLDDFIESYSLVLPRYRADEHGKILLRKAVEYVRNQGDLLRTASVKVEAVDGTYHLRLKSNDCCRDVETIVREVLALIESLDTIQERSRNT